MYIYNIHNPEVTWALKRVCLVGGSISNPVKALKVNILTKYHEHFQDVELDDRVENGLWPSKNETQIIKRKLLAFAIILYMELRIGFWNHSTYSYTPWTIYIHVCDLSIT